jgi:SAM-dependent methyltransferase
MTTTQELLEHLGKRQNFKPATWLEQLEERKREEIEFHNFDRERHDAAVLVAQKARHVHANKKYYSISDSSKEWVDRWVERHARDRVFLDYACGDGFRAIQAAQAGAQIAIGLDISDVSIVNAREAARNAKVSDKCVFVQGDCEATELPADSIDAILCSGMLHHLDLNRAYLELYRILKPGGRILGVEAFGHNPFIQLYRDLTPNLRTNWEKKHILKQRDIDAALRHGFIHGEVRYWHLFALGAVPFRRTPLFNPALALLNAMDRAVLDLPGIRLMAWQVTFELIKPGNH